MKEKIISANTYLGIELGSTRIKALLIDDSFAIIAEGSFKWENKFENNYWTYSLEDIHKGVKECYKSLADDVKNKFDVELERVGAIGISAMMHGYLAFDKEDNLLVPFRTWRNTTTEQAATELTKLFKFNIPQRWSIAHLYQAILNGEDHVKDISYITTLAGYVHYLLTGKREVGIGDASGIFPVSNGSYDNEMIEKFRNLVSEKGYEWDICDILPEVKVAGEKGSVLTEEGAGFLDSSSRLKAGILVCPPEGDAETGMVATNSVLPKTGNVSAGTSIFSMLVLEKQLKNIYPQIDVVMTPDGSPVAMVHCNNCCAELDSWVSIFGEFAELVGDAVDTSKLYDLLYNHTENADDDCGGVTAYNYLSGEHVTEITKGRPMYFRLPEGNMNLANFMKSQLYSAFAALTIGMDILFSNEEIDAEQFLAHGGLFKVPGIAQRILANALKTPVCVMETAGEGGAWGMAVLAAYMIKSENKPLGEWLISDVFADMKSKKLYPDEDGIKGFEEYMKRYKTGLLAENNLAQV